MKKNIPTADDKTQYSQYLSNMLDELCISQPQLAKAIGRSQKTVSRYALGESMPDETTKETIEKFLREQSVYNGFRHIPSEEFAKLLGTLLEEFKGSITQEQLAQKIGKYQKDISRYLYHLIKPDTKTQHDILRVFYRLCRMNGIFVSAHVGTGFYLHSLLEEYCFTTSFGEEKAPELGEQGTPGDFVQYCMHLPHRLQQLILDQFYAFFDNYGYEVCMHKNPFFFRELAAISDLFRQLSPLSRKTALAELEKDAFVGYPQNDAEYIFFRQITAYRQVIMADPLSIMAGSIDSETQQTDLKEKETMIMSFESYISLCYWKEKDMIKELEYKLRMSRQEWYLWMLLLTYRFKGNDLCLYYNRLLEMIHK